MKKAPYLVLLLVLAGGLVACGGGQSTKQDPNKAAATAGVTLRQLYFDSSYDLAYASLDSSFRSITTLEALKSIITKEADLLGPISEIRAEAYLPAKGSKSLVLFFQGTHEKGPAYYRLDMAGDANGYRVASLQVGGGPFAEASGSDAVQFKDPLVISR